MNDVLKEELILPDTLSDEYEVISCIRSGKTDSVYVLYDKVCRRKALLKAGKAEIIENEARILAELDEKGIPEVYGCFEMDGKTCLIRQYINGKTLYEHIKESGPFSCEKAIEIGISVCRIIAALHEKEPTIIHRDVKSDNIIITPDGEVYIIDFGTAREYDPDASRDTQVLGTPDTAPPEQFGYGQTDERSDVYSIGVLLNELVTGSTKLEASGMPRRLSAVIKRCTEFAPEKRYRNAAECEAALRKMYKKTPAAAVLAAVSGIAVFVLVLALASNLRSDNVEDAVYTSAASDTTSSESEVTTSALSESYSEGKNFIQLDSSYVGDWNYGAEIPKSILDSIDGDVQITLDIETLAEGKDGDYYSLKPVSSDDRWTNLKVLTLFERAGDDGRSILVGKNQKTCKFTVSREVIETLGDGGIAFQIYNLLIKSATVEKAVEEATEYEEITDTKTPYFIELDSEYLGDYALSKTIPKSVLENYEGDIKITLETEIAGLYNYANFIPIALVGDDAEWMDLIGEIDCENDRNSDGFINLEKGQTECTLILSHDAVEKLGKYGIGFRTVNFIVKSAKLSDADA